MTHQKHTKLVKPDLGHFGRHEWAIMGTSCGQIQKLALALSQSLQHQPNSKYKTAYIDADHKAGDDGESLPYFMSFTDKINFNRVDFQGKMSDYQTHSFFNETDIVFINGNHFKGNRQIVVLDSKKFDSLSRKLERLTRVEAFISFDTNLLGEEGQIPDFLKDHIHNWSEIPIFSITEVEKIAQWLIVQSPIPHIQALLLVGGKSTRMGRDKSHIDYHGKPQWQFMADILRGIHLDVFLSCRQEQTGLYGNENLIVDTFTDLGPFGAILSAFRENPNTAWLVVACDLPLLTENTLKTLIESRNPSAIATTYRSPESKEGFPEPLITIWEPKSYAVLLQFLAQGVSCPRKVLINSDTHIIDPAAPEALMNVNTPEEMGRVTFSEK
jgi:molybdenum cofactor guanylyltransferase